MPGSGNIVYFRGGSCSGANCNVTINANISVFGMGIDSAYAGTITQASTRTVTVGSSGWFQAGGTFSGGDSAITQNGAVSISAGSFTSTSGTMTLKNSYDISGGTFVHNSGTLNFNTSTSYLSLTITAGSGTYYNVSFTATYTTYTLADTITVNGTLSLADTSDNSYINTGTFVLKGDLSTTSKGFKGTALIQVAGSSNQTIAGTSLARILKTEIISTGGTVTFSGYLLFYGDYKWTSGTVDAGTSTVQFGNNYRDWQTYSITPGAIAYNDVTFGAYYLHYTLNSGTLTVNGTLTIANTGSAGDINSGTIDAGGNVSLSSLGSPSGTAVINMVGTSSSNLSLATGASFPTGNFTINKTGGAGVTLTGTATTFTLNGASQNFTLTAGTLDMNGKNLTLKNLSLNGNIMTKNAGVLTVNSTIVGTGSLYGGTVNP